MSEFKYIKDDNYNSEDKERAYQLKRIADNSDELIKLFKKISERGLPLK